MRYEGGQYYVKSPEEMAQMTFNMIANAKDAFCQTASDFLDK